MVSDGQVKEQRRLLFSGKSLAFSARMTEMSDKTARNYRDDDRLPTQRKTQRDYRTRPDPFAEVWPEVQQRLEDQPRLKAHILFQWLQQTHPGEFLDSTRRTFERLVHHSVIIELNVPSYRVETAKKSKASSTSAKKSKR